jgi:hypothetical protein
MRSNANTSFEQTSNAAIAVLVVMGIWLFYVGLGLPLTTVDDLYFFGIADSWSKTGHLESRFMTADYLSGFPSGDFFYQPPTYPAIFALWLFVWPASELSVQTFSFAIMLTGIFGIIVICKHLSISVFATMIICALYFLSFSRLGLRPEVFSVGLLLLGTGLLLIGRPGRVLPGFLCYGVSILCYPFTLPAALAFTILAFVYWPRNGPHKVVLFASCGAAGVLLLACVNLWLIDWRVSQFFSTYRQHVEVVNPGAMFSPARYLEYLGKLSTDSKFLPKWPFVLIGPSLLVWASIFRKSSLKLLGFCCAFTFGVIGAAGMAHLRAVDLSVFYSLAVTAMLLDSMFRSRMLRLLGQLSVLGLALVANIAVVFSITLQTSISEEKIQEMRAKAAAVPVHQSILVDSSVARHVFDWKLGPNVYDFRTSRKLFAPFGANIYPRHINDIGDDEVWIVGRDFSYSTEVPSVSPRPLTLFGKNLGMVGSLKCDPLFISRENGMISVD